MAIKESMMNLYTISSPPFHCIRLGRIGQSPQMAWRANRSISSSELPVIAPIFQFLLIVGVIVSC